ncbi:MAG: hypothetical protein KIS92_26555 [Planctomycetota bacterium]|nr:hypothetical protein [Planctomycetota bacterium]
MDRLDVKADKLQFILVMLLGLFFVPMGLLVAIGGLSKGRGLAPVAIGVMCLLCFGAVFWLVRRGHARSVRAFTEEGLVRRDGKTFAWADLSRVVRQMHFNPRTSTTGVWRIEIQFKNGEAAWIIPMKVNNYREVAEYIRKLPCEQAEVKV